jgi:hypothetical protein
VSWEKLFLTNVTFCDHMTSLLIDSTFEGPNQDFLLDKDRWELPRALSEPVNNSDVQGLASSCGPSQAEPDLA